MDILGCGFGVDRGQYIGVVINCDNEGGLFSLRLSAGKLDLEVVVPDRAWIPSARHDNREVFGRIRISCWDPVQTGREGSALE